jgi:hypothetical protein
VALRYLAIQRIVGDPDRISDFNKDQKEKLTKMAQAAELDLRVAVTRAYRHFYYPAADAPKQSGGLSHQLLQPDEQGEMDKDQSEVVLRVLKSLEKVLTADDKPLAPQYLKSKAWDVGAVSISTEELRRAFARRRALKMLLNVEPLKRTIRDGIANGTWVYYSSEERLAYGQQSVAPLVEISEDVLLYTPEEVQRLKLRIQGAEAVVETCVVCGKEKSACICALELEKKPGLPRLQAEGTPAQSFQAVADQCHDHKVKALRRLCVQLNGLGKDAARDARSLGLAIPQIGKAAVSMEQELVLEFGSEKFRLDFTGSWDRYKRIKTLTDALSPEASNASVRLTMRADFDGDGLDVNGSQFQTIRDVFDKLGIGRIAVEGEPVSEGEAHG